MTLHSYVDDELELWNLAPGVTALVGPQSHFNVVGRVKRCQEVESLSYWINGSGPRPVPVARTDANERLQRAGDFSIDTLDATELREQRNELAFEVARVGRPSTRREIRFGVRRSGPEPRSFTLDLNGEPAPCEVGQVVEGHWRTERDEHGERCVAIRPEDYGYDRIILFGHGQWTHGYEVKARLSPTRWMRATHNLGLLFRWNPHLRGDGTTLPAQWTTGLAYYYSTSPGLRLRFGVDVHVDQHGIKRGDHVLSEKPYSWWRAQIMRPRLVGLRHRFLASAKHLSQLPAGRQYWFRLRVDYDRLALSVWERGRREPRPQLEVTENVDVINQGAVGVIALNCGARVYEYEVRPA